ncbi:MAG: SGNH/GDSL hydrolase family protein [Microthrixaceae bacterium]
MLVRTAIAASAMAVLAITTAVVLAATSPSGTSSATVAPGNAEVRGVVLFAGDSNVTLAATNIVNVLTWRTHTDNGYVPVVAGRVNASIRTYDCATRSGCTTTDYWPTKLGNIFDRANPDAVVVNLGINDALGPGSETTPGYSKYPEKIDYLMRSMGGRPVLWTNLPCNLEPEAWRQGCAAINRALASASSRWPNLTVLDWSSRAKDHPEYMNAGDVHLTSTGHAAWANFVVQALDARFVL